MSDEEAKAKTEEAGEPAPSPVPPTASLEGDQSPADPELQQQAAELRRIHAQICRDDAAEFCAFVLRDEKFGGGIEPSAAHYRWHALCDKHPRLVIWSHTESGKTQQLAIGRTLWMLGRDPNLRIAIISNTYSQAVKIVRTIAQYIESSAELHEVFPELRKSDRAGDPWSANAITVKRGVISKDASVQACGVHGAILGARLDVVILDDILDFENTRTVAARNDLADWYHATITGRLTEWARVWAIGTAFHPDDLLHRFVRPTNVWTGEKFPVLDEAGNPTWPEKWPLSRVNARRVELGAAEFDRQMLCKARSDEEARFQRAWIDACVFQGLGFIYEIPELPDGFAAFTGVDLGVGRKEGSGKTALFDVLLHPTGERQILWIESGRFTGPEIVRKIHEHQRRYNSIVYVENNAAQDFIRQFALEGNALPIRPFTTGASKAHPEFGIEGIAVEMQNGKWIIPGGAQGEERSPEVDSWISELLYYDPREHPGDRLMAGWFAREGARRFDYTERGSTGVTIVTPDSPSLN